MVCSHEAVKVIFSKPEILRKREANGLNIKRLEFVLTEKCNSRCAHCQGDHSPEREGVMKVEDGLNYLVETASVTRLDSFMIFGGEAMLYPQSTIRLFQKAKELGIPEIELITNGSWGKDPEEARTLAFQLKEAGVTDVLISVDGFHLPYIPLDWPRNAKTASVEAGIKRVSWNVAVLEGLDAPNEFDRQTRQIVKILEPSNLEVHFNKIWPQGRARHNLRNYFPEQPLGGACPEKETTLVRPNCISLDPAGWASICWNMAIGNTKEVPLSKLLTSYSWEKHPITKTLVEEGPLGLTNLPESEGFRYLEAEYIDKCHLCCELRMFMRRAYPEMYIKE